MSATSLSQSTTSTQSSLFAGRYKILIFVEGGGNREGGQGRAGRDFLNTTTISMRIIIVILQTNA